jgi:hypothetical protein
MMMHEDWGMTQNYVVADAGEIRIGSSRFAVEKRISPLRCSQRAVSSFGRNDGPWGG